MVGGKGWRMGKDIGRRRKGAAPIIVIVISLVLPLSSPFA